MRLGTHGKWMEQQRELSIDGCVNVMNPRWYPWKKCIPTSHPCHDGWRIMLFSCLPSGTLLLFGNHWTWPDMAHCEIVVVFPEKWWILPVRKLSTFTFEGEIMWNPALPGWNRFVQTVEASQYRVLLGQRSHARSLLHLPGIHARTGLLGRWLFYVVSELQTGIGWYLYIIVHVHMHMYCMLYHICTI